MRKMACLTMFVFSTLLAFSHTQAQADEVRLQPLSLDTAIALALAHNIGYRISHTAVIAARAQLAQISALRKPQIGLRDTLAYSDPVARLNTPFGALPFSSSTMTNTPLLSLQYDLSDGGRSAARFSEKAAELSIADEHERDTRIALIDTTVKAYFDLAEALESKKLADHSVAVAQNHYHDAQHLYAAGQVPYADVLRAKAEVANQRMLRIDTYSAIDIAQLTLNTTLGISLEEVHQPTENLAIARPNISLHLLLATFEQNRPDIGAAHAAVDAARAALKEARSINAPQVGISASDGNEQPTVIAGYQNQFSLGLNAVWKLFDGGAGRDSIAAAQASLDQAELAVNQLQNEAEFQVRHAYLTLTESEARSAAAIEYETSADESLRLAQVRYRGGVSTLFELEDAQLRAMTARQSALAASVAVREDIVHLRFATGLL